MLLSFSRTLLFALLLPAAGCAGRDTALLTPTPAVPLSYQTDAAPATDSEEWVRQRLAALAVR